MKKENGVNQINDYQGNRYNPKHKENLDRTLFIPDVLFNLIPKHQKGKVFLKLNTQNYDTLINTHVYLSIKHSFHFIFVKL